jgi:hypothetical protein
LQFGPAPPEVTQDAPEEAAVHQSGNAPAPARSEGKGLGVFQVVRDFMKEGIEDFFEWAPALHAIQRIDPHQASRPVIAAQDPLRGTRVDVYKKLNPAFVNSLEPVAEKGP